MTKLTDLSKVGSNLVDVDAIIASVENIISIRVGELPFNRSFGTRLEDYLFNQITFSNSRIVLSEVISSISRWEKRVEISSKTTVTPDVDNRSYKVNLVLEISGLENSISLVKTLTKK